MGGWWAGVLAVLAVYILYRAFWGEPNRWVVERHTVPIPSLPSSLDGMEIVHLSDLHLGGRVRDREHQLVELVRSLPAPVLVVTGDFLREDAALGNLVPLLMEMGRDKQAFAVFGDEDYKMPGRVGRLVSVLEGAGVTPLQHRAVTLSARDGGAAGAGKGKLWLVGLDYGALRHPGAGSPFAGVEPGGPVVALVHEPSAAAAAIQEGAHLVLAGHTLGGRIRLPVASALLDRLRAGGGPRRGLVRYAGGWVYVNRGWGTPGLQLRLFSPPEVAVLRLVKEG